MAHSIPPTRYLDTKETKAVVMKALNEAFPGVKFTARCRTYSGGASMTARWTDGPDVTRVDKILQTFAAARMDIQADYKALVTHEMAGHLVSYAFDFITPHRLYSEAFLLRAVSEAVKPGTHLHDLGARAEMFTVRPNTDGELRLYSDHPVTLQNRSYLRWGRIYDEVTHFVGETSADFYLDADASRTANSVTPYSVR